MPTFTVAFILFSFRFRGSFVGLNCLNAILLCLKISPRTVNASHQRHLFALELYFNERGGEVVDKWIA